MFIILKFLLFFNNKFNSQFIEMQHYIFLKHRTYTLQVYVGKNDILGLLIQKVEKKSHGHVWATDYFLFQ